MRSSTLELLKDLCLLGFGCALLGFGSCNGPKVFAQEVKGNMPPAVKKCARQGIPMKKMIFVNQYERNEK